jgi:hypothetical protein
MNKVKQDVAEGFKTFPGIIKNGKTIVSVGSLRAKEAIVKKARAIKTIVSDGTQEVIGTVLEGINSANSNVENFIGNLFGGKD